MKTAKLPRFYLETALGAAVMLLFSLNRLARSATCESS